MGPITSALLKLGGVVLAQAADPLAVPRAVPDPLSGGAGWVGAGLLGLVLGWLLLKHLPDKDRQLKELLDSRDKLMSDQLTQERAASERRQTELVGISERRHAETREDWKKHDEHVGKLHADVFVCSEKQVDGQKEMRHALYNLTQQISNWILIARYMLKIDPSMIVPPIVPGTDELEPKTGKQPQQPAFRP